MDHNRLGPWLYTIATNICRDHFRKNRRTKPLQQVVVGLKDIAEGEGDLTNRLEVKSQDEMGELARWFNVFIEKIQAVIRDVAQNTGYLHDNAQQMSAGADQTSGKANTKEQCIHPGCFLAAAY